MKKQPPRVALSVAGWEADSTWWVSDCWIYVMSISFTYNVGVYIIGALVNFPINMFCHLLIYFVIYYCINVVYIFKFVMIVKRIEQISIYYALHKYSLILLLLKGWLHFKQIFSNTILNNLNIEVCHVGENVFVCPLITVWQRQSGWHHRREGEHRGTECGPCHSNVVYTHPPVPTHHRHAHPLITTWPRPLITTWPRPLIATWPHPRNQI